MTEFTGAIAAVYPTPLTDKAFSASFGDPTPELVRRAKGGDRQAFETLIRQHQAQVAAVVFKMVSRREDAEDLVADIFLQVYKNLPGFRGDAKFSTWLLRVAVNMTLKRLPKLRRQSGPSVEEMAEGGLEMADFAPEGSPAQRAEAADRRERVRRAVEHLSPKHQAVVNLYYFQQKSCEEIAEILDCSVGTVWSRLHYALKCLRPELITAGVVEQGTDEI
jgi:RNA polymerase sigma-70 factor (ECF subfamily)